MASATGGLVSQQDSSEIATGLTAAEERQAVQVGNRLLDLGLPVGVEDRLGDACLRTAVVADEDVGDAAVFDGLEAIAGGVLPDFAVCTAGPSEGESTGTPGMHALEQQIIPPSSDLSPAKRSSQPQRSGGCERETHHTRRRPRRTSNDSSSSSLPEAWPSPRRSSPACSASSACPACGSCPVPPRNLRQSVLREASGCLQVAKSRRSGCVRRRRTIQCSHSKSCVSTGMSSCLSVRSASFCGICGSTP